MIKPFTIALWSLSKWANNRINLVHVIESIFFKAYRSFLFCSLLLRLGDKEPPFTTVLSRVAQSVARLTHEPEVPGSIPGPATYFLLRLIQEGQLSVTGGTICTKYW